MTRRSYHAGLLFLFGLLMVSAPAFADPAEKLWVDPKPRPDKARVLTESSFTKLAQIMSPSVVNIIATTRDGDGTRNEWFEPRAGRTSFGSGFIIRADGHVLTNNHVVEGATELKVRLNDKREFRAYVVGRDPKTDVALVKIEGGKVTFNEAPLGNSDSLGVGDRVLAIGNPLGLNHTVTSGIVSALDRKNLAPGGKVLDADLIQTDASINPGNSGGPLIGLNGDVIGINTAIRSDGQGIGFAIPINVVKQLLPHLKKRGFVERSMLGFRGQSITPLLARSFGLKKPQGVVVSRVAEKSSASRGGLKVGDVILGFGKVTVKDRDHLNRLISMGGAGKVVLVSIMRAKKPMSLTVTLEAVPNQAKPTLTTRKASKEVIAAAPKLKNLGLTVKALPEKLARQLGAQGLKGVVVSRVEAASPVRASGLHQRDVILEVGDTSVSSVEQFYTLLNAQPAGAAVRFRVVRGGRVAYMVFER